jgi:hypothetical protein
MVQIGLKYFKDISCSAPQLNLMFWDEHFVACFFSDVTLERQCSHVVTSLKHVLTSVRQMLAVFSFQIWSAKIYRSDTVAFRLNFVIIVQPLTN